MWKIKSLVEQRERERTKRVDEVEERKRTRGKEWEERGRSWWVEMGEELQKKPKKKPGHLVRWNYISNAHTALMLLSHQHIAQAEMVYVYVCESVCMSVSVWALEGSKGGFALVIFTQTLSPYLALICTETISGQAFTTQWSMCGTVSVPVNACSNSPKRKKETLRGVGVHNVRNYYLT